MSFRQSAGALRVLFDCAGDCAGLPSLELFSSLRGGLSAR
jgi:hypothetical protein